MFEDLPSTVEVNKPDPAGSADLERLVDAEIERWQAGTSPCAEAFLDRHPELRARPEAAIRLIYEEFCLRREQGQALESSEVLRRFPQWSDQLQVLLRCHDLLDLEPPPPSWPAAGEALGEFRLLRELGRGAVGRVFLACQAGLAGRQVVLKLTPCSGEEHLSLARLQHTNIVPLYAAYEDDSRRLRVMCMPYFGGVPLHRILSELSAKPPADRSGRDLLEALDRLQQKDGLSSPARGPMRHLLGRASYTQAVCLIGACLADALQYAHERGLIHLDVKPPNVLLAADAQPMLLDFHVAQRPVRPGDTPDGLGGTHPYMSPEQKAAMTAVKQGKPVRMVVDGRSDIYSLGLLLYEALAGQPLRETESPGEGLRRNNPQVPAGLADVVASCLAGDPRGRCQDAGELAAGLRRHLSNQRALRGQRLWRSLVLGGLAAAVVGAVLLTGLGFRRSDQDRQAAEAALSEGRQLLRRGDNGPAAETLNRGLASAEKLHGAGGLETQLRQEFRKARRGQLVEGLHDLAEQMRFAYGTMPPAASALPAPESWRALWDKRDQLMQKGVGELDEAVEHRLKLDLLDLAVMWADLRLRLAAPPEVDRTGREALRVLEEAEALFGPCAILYRERQECAERLGLGDLSAETARRGAGLEPRSAWEHWALGRSLLLAGDLSRAALLLGRAVDLEPQGFWPNYYQGVCAYRLGRHQDAARAFRVCVALAPRSADCYYNRGLTHVALGEHDRALHDYDRALQLNPKLAAAALNRGLLHYQNRRYEQALADLQYALGCGADEGVVLYNQALVHLARKDRLAALATVRRALAADPAHADARALLDRLQRDKETRRQGDKETR